MVVLTCQIYVEILQVNTASQFNDDPSYQSLGRDISCNLGSMNIAKVLDGKSIGRSVEVAIRALTAVSEMSAIDSVPLIRKGNDQSHAIGLGQMNLHGFLAREKVHYDLDEAVDFTRCYFACVLFYCLKASNRLAQENKVSLWIRSIRLCRWFFFSINILNKNFRHKLKNCRYFRTFGVDYSF